MVRSMIALLLIVMTFPLIRAVSVRLSERWIYEQISERYSNLTYDRELSRIAENFAERCCTEHITDDDIKVLSDKEFIKRASKQSYVTKYTVQAESDEAFVEQFLTDMISGENQTGRDEGFQKSTYIGVGKYENQVFLLAFYNKEKS